MQAQERPVFRQDLVAEAVEEQGARYIDVADPDSGHMFRFFEVEYAIACAMDGQRDVAGIVKWAQEELGVTPSPKEVQTVIATLADLKFIETGATRLSDVPEAKAAAKKSADEEATTVGGAAFPSDDLAPGIVVGKAAAASSGMDVELGASGSQAAKPVEAPLPKADFDLGAPGAAAAAKPAAKAPVEDFALGAPGAAQAKHAAKPAAPAADLSMDLTADMPVKAADVKEAVRASKVMTAVEVPKELQDELDKPAEKPAVTAKPAEKPVEKVAEKKPAEKPVEKAAEKKPAEKAAAEKKPAEKTPAEKAAEKKPAEKAAAEKKPAEKKAVTLPKQPAEKTPVAPPAPQQKVSPVLVVLLILAAVGAGAFFFWKFVLDKPEEAAPQTKAPPPTPPAPPPPAEAKAQITLETPPAQEIKAPAGAIETIEAADKDVKTGDTIATLVGAKAINTEMEKLRGDIEKASTAIEAATAELAAAQQKENNQAGVTAAQAKLDKVKKPVDDKKATLAKKQADLDKLIVKSPTDGKLATTKKVGDKVTADEVIGTINRATVPVATFKIPAGTKVGADGNLSLTAGDKTVVCTVSDAQAETIKVTCPADSGLANGADVKFVLPK